MEKYLKFAQLASREKTNGGILYLFPDIFTKMATLILLVFLWRVAMSSGVQVDMSSSQMLSYTYISALLSDMLVVSTPATGWLSEGVLMRLYGRPASILGQLAALTVGGWLPTLLLFSLPMALIAPLLEVSLLPVTVWFLPSLLLCISLGFAIDLLFACLTMRLRNMTWLVERIRVAIVAVFSGTVIPINLLPLGLSDVMKYQPFACLGGSPLSVFVGVGETGEILALQLLWNLLLWPLALFLFRKSQERMVSYGG